MDQELHESLHVALAAASDEPPQSAALVVSSFKVRQDDLDAVKAICENNNATVGAFIRQIFHQLISDYVPDYGRQTET